VAVLEVGHSLFQRLGTLGGNLVTEEGDLGCWKDALRWVDDDPVPLKLVEESCSCSSSDREKTGI
jgi:hypothetical protein